MANYRGFWKIPSNSESRTSQQIFIVTNGNSTTTTTSKTGQRRHKQERNTENAPTFKGFSYTLHFSCRNVSTFLLLNTIEIMITMMELTQ